MDILNETPHPNTEQVPFQGLDEAEEAKVEAREREEARG